MKKLLLTTTFLAAMAGSVMADAFDTLSFNTELYVSDFRLSVNSTEGNGTELGLAYHVWGLENDWSVQQVTLELGHVVRTDEVRVTAEYGIAAPVNDTFAVYGTLALNALTEDAFSTTDFTTDVTAGVSAYATDSIVAYLEVTSTHDLSSSFDRLGTVAELGADVHLTDSLSLTPFVTYDIDVAKRDRVQGGLTLAVRF
jgi:hypothetical protein